MKGKKVGGLPHIEVWCRHSKQEEVLKIFRGVSLLPQRESQPMCQTATDWMM